MNILFFDFDGVLAAWPDWVIYDDDQIYKPASMISNNRIRYINEQLKREDLEAVFFPISSWSYVFRDKKDLEIWLKEMKLDHLKAFDGIGPHFYCDTKRGEFIKKLLKDNNVQNYIIFDDEELENEYKDLNIIKTAMYDGILHEHIKQFHTYIEKWK